MCVFLYKPCTTIFTFAIVVILAKPYLVASEQKLGNVHIGSAWEIIEPMSSEDSPGRSLKETLLSFELEKSRGVYSTCHGFELFRSSVII